jgi:predicted transcriptional regulator
MRRTEPIMRMDILQVLAFQGPLKKTHLTCKANIGFKKLVNFLDNLVVEGLVKERETDNKHIVYLITTKGLRAFKDSPRVTS